MENNQDSFSRLGESQGDLSSGNLLDGDDPFNDSVGDALDKFMMDDFDRSNRSGGIPDSALLLSANDSTFQDMVDSTLDKVADEVMNVEGSHPSSFGLSGGNMTGNPPLTLGSAAGSDSQKPSANKNWFLPSTSNASQQQSSSSMLDAAPLNISLGRPAAPSGSSSNIASMLRRKGSNTQIHGMKLGAARKVGLTSSKLRSAKSEGMLARALKSKYNSGNSLNKYNVNAAEASAVINSRYPRNSFTAHSSNRLSQSNMYGGSGANLSAVAEGGSGSKNATWGASPTRKPGASLFADILSSPTGERSTLGSGAAAGSNSSISSLLRQQKLSSGGSRTSFQDLLRLSKKQSKTQSALRQSSAQSLMRKTSSQSLKGQSQKVDVSGLLPPDHAMKGLRVTGHAPSPKITTGAKTVVSSPLPAGEGDSSSLLHQSCRLYPTTAAVVESALRMDPDAVRKALPAAPETGQSKKMQNVYGYPINVAMTHGGSVEVIKMLIEAGPDVLVQKDGSNGAGSLGIALANKVDMAVVEMLVQANPECVQVADRRGNYPLHVAVSNGLPFSAVKHLHSLYPQALQMRNFHSQTPLDIAQRSTLCSEEVMNYLQSSAFSPLEHGASHLDQHNRSDLEDGLDDIMEANF